jgi:hypothetical protein
MEFMIKYFIATVCVTVLMAAPASADKVYRWVDEDGNVHYTESLPPGFKDTGHDVLNERGIVVDENLKLTPPPVEEQRDEELIKAKEAGELPRDSSGLPRPKPLYTEEQKQRRMDNFLMLRYESEQEITDAMNVEIKQLNYDRRLIEGSIQSILESWRGQIREAADKQRAGKTVGDEDVRQMNDLQSKLAQSNRSLASLEARERDIRQEFNAQLERYRRLVEQYAEDNPGR